MNNPLRICHVSDCLPVTHNFWGGAEQASMRIMEASVRSGLDVSVITTKPDTNSRPEGMRFFSVPTLESYINPAIVTGLSLKHLGFDPLSYIHIRRILKELRPDIVHLHRTVILTLSPVMAARLLGIPVVVTVYDYFNFCPKETMVDEKGNLCVEHNGRHCSVCMGLSGWRGLIRRPFVNIRKKIFDLFLRDVVFHVLSASSFNILEAYGIRANRIRKIPQIFPLKEHLVSSPVKKGLILYVGWIQERKGFHILLNAMSQILSSCLFSHIIAIGTINNDEYFDKIQNIMKSRGLENQVVLMGKKNYEEVAKYLDEANVVVIPEQWDNMSPVVLIEAMSHGKAVVASRIGGIPEFVTDGESGILADPSSPADFAQKIIKLLNDDKEVLRIGCNARQHITGLMDEKSLMKTYKSLYEGMIEKESVS